MHAHDAVVALRERVKNPLKLFTRNTRPRIAHDDLYRRTSRLFASAQHIDAHRATLGELQGIPGHVNQDLLELTWRSDQVILGRSIEEHR